MKIPVVTPVNNSQAQRSDTSQKSTQNLIQELKQFNGCELNVNQTTCYEVLDLMLIIHFWHQSDQNNNNSLNINSSALERYQSHCRSKCYNVSEVPDTKKPDGLYKVREDYYQVLKNKVIKLDKKFNQDIKVTPNIMVTHARLNEVFNNYTHPFDRDLVVVYLLVYMIADNFDHANQCINYAIAAGGKFRQILDLLNSLCTQSISPPIKNIQALEDKIFFVSEESRKKLSEFILSSDMKGKQTLFIKCIKIFYKLNYDKIFTSEEKLKTHEFIVSHARSIRDEQTLLGTIDYYINCLNHLDKDSNKDSNKDSKYFAVKLGLYVLHLLEKDGSTNIGQKVGELKNKIVDLLRKPDFIESFKEVFLGAVDSTDMTEIKLVRLKILGFLSDSESDLSLKKELLLAKRDNQDPLINLININEDTNQNFEEYIKLVLGQNITPKDKVEILTSISSKGSTKLFDMLLSNNTDGLEEFIKLILSDLNLSKEHKISILRAEGKDSNGRMVSGFSQAFRANCYLTIEIFMQMIFSNIKNNLIIDDKMDLVMMSVKNFEYLYTLITDPKCKDATNRFMREILFSKEISQTDIMKIFLPERFVVDKKKLFAGYKPWLHWALENNQIENVKEFTKLVVSGKHVTIDFNASGKRTTKYHDLFIFTPTQRSELLQLPTDQAFIKRVNEKSINMLRNFFEIIFSNTYEGTNNKRHLLGVSEANAKNLLPEELVNILLAENSWLYQALQTKDGMGLVKYIFDLAFNKKIHKQLLLTENDKKETLLFATLKTLDNFEYLINFALKVLTPEELTKWLNHIDSSGKSIWNYIQEGKYFETLNKYINKIFLSEMRGDEKVKFLIGFKPSPLHLMILDSVKFPELLGWIANSSVSDNLYQYRKELLLSKVDIDGKQENLLSFALSNGCAASACNILDILEQSNNKIFTSRETIDFIGYGNGFVRLLKNGHTIAVAKVIEELMNMEFDIDTRISFISVDLEDMDYLLENCSNTTLPIFIDNVIENTQISKDSEFREIIELYNQLLQYKRNNPSFKNWRHNKSELFKKLKNRSIKVLLQKVDDVSDEVD